MKLCGIAQDDPSSLAFLRPERGLGFPLFADPDGSGLWQWGVQDANAIFLLDRERRVLQRALGERAPAEAMLRSRTARWPAQRRRGRAACAAATCAIGGPRCSRARSGWCRRCSTRWARGAWSVEACTCVC